jgi:hypothetical protein
MDSLNHLLQSQWTKSKTETIMTIDQENFDIDGNPFTTEWHLVLGSPQLTFTIEGKAELVMALGGSWHNLGTDSKGKPHPTSNIPKDVYQLVAVVPIGLISATEGASSKVRIQNIKTETVILILLGTSQDSKF